MEFGVVLVGSNDDSYFLMVFDDFKINHEDDGGMNKRDVLGILVWVEEVKRKGLSATYTQTA